jgi:23S rRNA-/tRNA-specific pseudouridylate synthase
LTSGVFIIPRFASVAREMANQIKQAKVNKEYVARVKGHFPG